MIRRRRSVREIAFSFDSFLDVVANVVGIIIRLILVAWVGARSYTTFVPPPTAVVKTRREPPEIKGPPIDEHRRELARAQAALLDQFKQLAEWQSAQDRLRG